MLPLAVVARSSEETTCSVTSRLDVQYGNAGGEELLLDVFIPSGEIETTTPETLRTAVLLVHGGGWCAGHRSAFHHAANWFAERGFVAFSVGYRLVRPGRNQWPAQLQDVQLAVRWVRHHAAEYKINPRRIGGVGGSAGGHLVSMLALVDTSAKSDISLPQYSSKLDAVVNWAGPSDFTVELPAGKTGTLNVQELVNGMLGTAGAERLATAREASPLFHVSAEASPMLIVHGTLDNLVPVDQSIRFSNALKSAGSDVKLILLEGEGHGLSPANYERLLRESAVFFNNI